MSIKYNNNNQKKNPSSDWLNKKGYCKYVVSKRKIYIWIEMEKTTEKPLLTTLNVKLLVALIIM